MKILTDLKGVMATMIDYREFVDLALSMRQPGLHNRLNAGVVRAVARVLGIGQKISDQALSNFSGTWRRFEYKGNFSLGGNKIEVYDDYGHHPTEIKATISGTREIFPRSI
jgi:UDP-N-acetylmuramate--alanine ligase